MQKFFREFEEHVFFDLWIPHSGSVFWFPDSGFRILVSGFWFPVPDSGFRFPGFRVALSVHQYGGVATVVKIFVT